MFNKIYNCPQDIKDIWIEIKITKQYDRTYKFINHFGHIDFF